MQDITHSWVLFFIYLIACGQAAWITTLWSGDLHRAQSNDTNQSNVGGLQAGVAIFVVLTVSTKHLYNSEHKECTHVMLISSGVPIAHTTLHTYMAVSIYNYRLIFVMY